MNDTQLVKDNDNGMKALFQGASYAIEQAFKNAPYDKTYIGFVKNVHLETNTYDVIINGHDYTNIMSTIRTYENHTVIIKCPQNQLSQMFIYGEIDTTDYSETE